MTTEQRMVGKKIASVESKNDGSKLSLVIKFTDGTIADLSASAAYGFNTFKFDFVEKEEKA